ncbi:class I adenylate-forming enzyme family protein [Actinotignum sp. GS-2025c]|uniref:class I adenylate-forming enzyme family protein n=1 Tax=Actinotignum sp. GS-2025c TaxID=3427276 RepID=UPI003F4755A9
MSSVPVTNVAYLLDRTAFANPDRTCLHYDATTLTVGEARDTTSRLAQLFVQAGVSHGDRVMIVAHNSPYHYLVAVACARIGAVFVPVDARLHPVEIQRLVDFAAPRVLIACAEIGTAGAFTSTGTPIHFVIDDDVLAPPFTPALTNGYIALSAATGSFTADFVADGTAGNPAFNTEGYPSGVAVMMFRPAPPEAPRALELTHDNLWWADRIFHDALGYGRDDIFLHSARCSSIAGFNGGTLFHFARGGRIVIARTPSPAGLLHLIEEHRVTTMFGTPTTYSFMLDDDTFLTRDLSSLRYSFVGGAAVPPALMGRLDAAGLHPLNMWGSVETGGVGPYLPTARVAHKAETVGRAMPHVEIRLVEPGTDTPVAPGEIGEMQLRGPSISAGYWHGDNYQRSSFAGEWFCSQDHARVDADGYISLVARVTDTIKTGGDTVHPEEIERVLHQYPGVRAALVTGVPDPVWGQVVGAAIVMDSHESSPEDFATPDPATGGFAVVPQSLPVPSLDQLRVFAAQALASFKLPRLLVVLDELPVDDDGKLSRARLRDLFGHGTAAPAPAAPAAF